MLTSLILIYLLGFIVTFFVTSCTIYCLSEAGYVALAKPFLISLVWFVFPIWFIVELIKNRLTTATKAVK